MNLLVKSKAEGRDVVALAEGVLEYVGFSAHRLTVGERLPVSCGDREICLVLLSGRVSVSGESPGQGSFSWENIGDRQSVFEEKSPFAVYLPPDSQAQVTALSAVQIAVCAAPGDRSRGLPARLIRPETMKRSVRGKSANTRYVCDILPDSEPAHSLLVVEVPPRRGTPPATRRTSTTRTICPTKVFWRKPTTTRSARRRASFFSACTPTIAASIRPWRWKTMIWSRCRRVITRSACLMATSRIT